MRIVTVITAGFLAGFIGSLGLGGGGVLVLFLTLFLGFSQLKAQGINLVFFIPVGFFALIWHVRKKLVSWRLAVPAIVTGLFGAAGGSFLAVLFGSAVTGKIFGAMLLALGLWELFHPGEKRSGKRQ